MKKKINKKAKNKRKAITKTKTKMKNKWPREAIDGQLSVTWPRTVIAFCFVHFASGLAVP